MTSAKSTILTAICLTIALATSTVTASTLPVDSFTTVFGQIPGPTPSAAGPGGLAPDVGLFPSPSVLNGIEGFSNFQVQNLNDGSLNAGSANTGQVLFLQSGGPTGFYVGGAGPATGNPLTSDGLSNLQELTGTTDPGFVNNRAYGVFGNGRSDITFLEGAVTSIQLQVRGTGAGDSIGPDPTLGQSLPENSPLDAAVATVLIYSNLGLIEQTTSNISTSDFQTITLDISGLQGTSITRVSLVNEGPLNSAIVLGELTVGTLGINPQGIPVPEPTSLALIGLAVGAAGVRRRR